MDALQVAVTGRNEVLLQPILLFLLNHISDPRFGTTASELAIMIIGEFGDLQDTLSC